MRVERIATIVEAVCWPGSLTPKSQRMFRINPYEKGAAAAVFLVASALRRGFRIKNVGANSVAIGGDGLNYANAVVLIQPGETWNENEALGAAWSCICGAGLASTINIQTIA
jgi:hypothetical protein